MKSNYCHQYISTLYECNLSRSGLRLRVALLADEGGGISSAPYGLMREGKHVFLRVFLLNTKARRFIKSE